MCVCAYHVFVSYSGGPLTLHYLSFSISTAPGPTPSGCNAFDNDADCRNDSQCAWFINNASGSFCESLPGGCGTYNAANQFGPISRADIELSCLADTIRNCRWGNVVRPGTCGSVECPVVIACSSVVYD